MIAIITSQESELTVFERLCDLRQWNSARCGSIRTAYREFRRAWPKVVLCRHRLQDGYSDDIIREVRNLAATGKTMIIVIMSAGSSAESEARQLNLGADCVLRDPVRSEVLLAYLEKYQNQRQAKDNLGTRRRKDLIPFAGATLQISDRRFRRGKKSITLTPREVELVEFLHSYRGEVTSYDALYEGILGRRFGGDTGNMRVLLNKLAASCRSIGITLREWVEVIPKSGYRYRV